MLNVKLYWKEVLSGLMVVFFSCFVSALSIKADKSQDNAFCYFKMGIASYKKGDKRAAINFLRNAADMGYPGASWKLAQMYARGDGVRQNDYEAYKLFSKVIMDGAETRLDNEAYVSNAFLELANYLRYGIANTPVKMDLVKARNYYMQAATNFANPDAQYFLGQMFFTGAGGKQSTLLAARWFKLAAKKGHVVAQAMLGKIWFQAGNTVQGLAMIIDAFERADAKNQGWIEKMRERAFSLVSERERKAALSLVSSITDERAY